MSTGNRPAVGDRVSILVPGNWERFAVVVETDYHPLGVEDAVKLRFKDEPDKPAEWWDLRWVMRVGNA